MTGLECAEPATDFDGQQLGVLLLLKAGLFLGRCVRGLRATGRSGPSFPENHKVNSTGSLNGMVRRFSPKEGGNITDQGGSVRNFQLLLAQVSGAGHQSGRYSARKMSAMSRNRTIARSACQENVSG